MTDFDDENLFHVFDNANPFFRKLKLAFYEKINSVLESSEPYTEKIKDKTFGDLLDEAFLEVVESEKHNLRPQKWIKLSD